MFHVLFGAVLFLPLIAFAQTGAPCHGFASGSVPPAGYGASWNLLSAGRELLLTSICQSDRVVNTVGTGAQDQFVYKMRYFYNTNESRWGPTSLSGTFARGSADWLIGRGTFESTSPDAGQQRFWVGYVCQWTGSAWKCGCRDVACATNYWQLQTYTWQSGGTTGGATGGTTGGTTAGSQVTPCAKALTLNVNAGNVQSTINANRGKCLVLDLAPGTYANEIDLGGLSGATVRCAAPALVQGKPNSNGCVFTGRYGVTTWDMHGTAILENLVFNKPTPTGTDAGGYGIRGWHAAQIRIANNAFPGLYNHAISFKYGVNYAEVLNNHFTSPQACIDAGQEFSWSGGTDWQTGTVIVRGNYFAMRSGGNGTNCIKNGDVRTMIIDRNTFGSPMHGNAVSNWAHGGTDAATRHPGYPKGNLRTEITNNTFHESATLRLEGRGSLTDVVLVKGNTGNYTCSRPQMSASAAQAISDEQTTAAPKLDPASDVSC